MEGLFFLQKNLQVSIKHKKILDRMHLCKDSGFVPLVDYYILRLTSEIAHFFHCVRKEVEIADITSKKLRLEARYFTKILLP